MSTLTIVPPLLLVLLAALLMVNAGSSNATEPPQRPDAAAAQTVVLVHGFGRSSHAMWWLDRELAEAGYDVVRLGYRSLLQTPQQILASVSAQIDACCLKRTARVHFVGHSLGGLMIRAYLNERRPQRMGRVVLIGSPSNGTPIVDAYRDAWWMQLAGPMALALGTGTDGFARDLPLPDYSIGVIAGVAVRAVSSELIPGRDDGLVPVDSTRIDGMADFIIVESSHSMMRYDADVARQSIAFLRRGRFLRTSGDE